MGICDHHDLGVFQKSDGHYSPLPELMSWLDNALISFKDASRTDVPDSAPTSPAHNNDSSSLVLAP